MFDGLGETGIKLVMVQDNQRFSCPEGGSVGAYDGSPGSYCRSNNTLVLAKGTFESEQEDFVKAGGTSMDYDRLLLGHEYGHGLQDVETERLGLENSNLPPNPTPVVEQQADCIDGMFMKNKQIATIAIDTWFEMVGDSPSLSHAKDAHGSAPVRKDAYLKGQSHVDGDMLNCGLTILPMGT